LAARLFLPDALSERVYRNGAQRLPGIAWPTRRPSSLRLRPRGGGRLFQARFASFAIDDAHVLNALRDFAFNPVLAGLAASPQTSART
jgi:hypothetical protein